MQENLSRWQPERAGLLNFWYYDEEQFQFADGKLLLRGSNGSGKSVTMQSFIPLLLDGNKSPERLDPFGSRARRMEDYLLGEGERGYDERTGYLWMEFSREGQYRTIGMGLKARRHRPMDFWGFVLFDGRRIGVDFSLSKKGKDDRGETQQIPLNKRELRTALDEGGEMVESQRDYMALVNQWIFQFATLEEYDELIKLLVQLRSPKLSKEFKPSAVYEIMMNSLPALTDDELRPLTEAIENMDQIQSHVQELKRNAAAANRIAREYDRYNILVLHDKAKGLVEEDERAQNLAKQGERTHDQLTEAESEFQQWRDTASALEREESALRAKESQLRDGDAFKLEEEYQRQHRLSQELEEQVKRKDDAAAAKAKREREVEQEMRRSQDQVAEGQDRVEDVLSGLDPIAETIGLRDHAHERDHFRRFLLERFGREAVDKVLAGMVPGGAMQAYDFQAWKNAAALYRDRLAKGLQALRAAAEVQRIYDTLLQEQDRLQRQQQDAAREEEQAFAQVDEGRQQYLQLWDSWREGAKEFAWNERQRQHWTQQVLRYGEGIDAQTAQRTMLAVYQEHRTNLERERLQRERHVEDWTERCNELRQQREAWLEQTDPEPERSEEAQTQRTRLLEKGAAVKPFFTVVDFRPDLDPVVQNRIEAALADMGLLDALFVAPEQDMEDLKAGAGLYLLPERIQEVGKNAGSETLASYLQPAVDCDGALEKDRWERWVQDVLHAIGTEQSDDGVYLTDQGWFGQGLLQGCGRQNDPARYIGRTARLRYRQQMLDELQAALSEAEGQWSQAKEELEAAVQGLQNLEWERDSMPEFSDLDTAVQQWQKAQRELEYLQEKVQDQGKKVSRQLRLVQEAKQEVYAQTRGMDLPAQVEKYAKALDDTSLYREQLNELASLHQRAVQDLRQLASLAERREELRLDVDELRGERNVLQDRWQRCQRQVEELDDLRQRPEIQALRAEAERIIARLQELPALRDEAAEKRGQQQQSAKDLAARLQELEGRQEAQRMRTKEAEVAFREEWVLGFVHLDTEGLQSREHADVQRASLVLDALESRLPRGQWDRDSVGQRLQEAVYSNQADLVDFGVEVGYLQWDLTVADDDPVADIRRGRRRYQVSGRLEGRTVSLYQLSQWLEQETGVQEQLLQETDRRLFEEIIMQTVGQKIRSKMYRAEQWVKRMNQLMGSRDTSSGLTFYLQWKPKPAPHEDELDTRELVEILKMNSSLVREDRFQKVTEHFRSKVARARQRLENGNITETFHQVVREVLDYRGWFEFQLHYDKEGEGRRVLTDRAFARLSGGEKAMAMYIPLFSSVYSRYQSAHLDAPRLIALDEAFAGVDETNIRDMFGLMEHLQFSYVINSQVIWGDYDTVEQLAICELVRPKNADFVSVLRFLWDGQQRHVVLDGAEMEPLLASGGDR